MCSASPLWMAVMVHDPLGLAEDFAGLFGESFRGVGPWVCSFSG